MDTDSNMVSYTYRIIEPFTKTSERLLLCSIKDFKKRKEVDKL